MSKEDAMKFLEAATTNEALREKFKLAANPEEFIKIASELGYTFTTQELQVVVEKNSAGVIFRRNTGVWPWLRSVNWK
jgi:predicted ribosomally synthesized peptide with nif11-like leader